MLKLMRTNKFFTYVLLSFFTVIIIVVFIFFGFTPDTNPDSVVVAKIENRKITLNEYWRAYERLYEAYRRSNIDEQKIKELNLKDKILNDLINENILLVLAEKEGVTVTDEELAKSIAEDETFKKDGKFDAQLYRKLLKYNKFTVDSYESLKRKDLTIAKIKGLIGDIGELSKHDLDNLPQIDNMADQLKKAILSGKKDQEANAYVESIKSRLKIEINESVYNQIKSS
jgi:peptidyl-prolyl cis-trans isomerase D